MADAVTAQPSQAEPVADWTPANSAGSSAPSDLAGTEARRHARPAHLAVAQASLPASLDPASSPAPAQSGPTQPVADRSFPPVTAHRPPVYVDRLRVHRSRTEPARTAGEQFGHRWCHLWSDDLAALHAMAKALGIRREWFQDRAGFPHYDLPPFRREKALAFGAVEHSLKRWLHDRRKATRDAAA